jgi:glycosyltransferase involved in cell wall biosynthesis
MLLPPWVARGLDTQWAIAVTRGASAIRVCFDATPLLGEMTGVGRFAAGALEALTRRDDVNVSAYGLTWRRRAALAGRLPEGARLAGIAMPDRPLRWCWSHGGLPPAECFLGNTDVLHGTNFTVPPARRSARIVTVHDLTPIRYPDLCEPGARAFAGALRRAAADGTWVHTPSRFVADEVVEELHVDPARVRWVYHGIPALGVSHADQSLATPGLPADLGRYVLAVGTAEPRKDLPTLVRAFDLLAGPHPDLALVIAGGSGWDGGALERAIASSPNRNRVVRTGYLGDEELAPVLASATLLAFPSLYEGFGFPPLQAMAAGVPVVATSAGALPEVLGEAALLVPAGDAEALGQAMDAVLDDDTLAAKLVESGLVRAAELTWERCAAGLAGLYAAAAADRARR